MKDIISLFFIQFLYFSLAQFTSNEISMLRKRAADAGFLEDEMNFLNDKIAESLDMKRLMSATLDDTSKSEMRNTLLQNFKDLLAFTNPKSDKHRVIPASAFAMAMKRRQQRLEKEEEERRQREKRLADQQYVEQLRKMELVENYIRDFERRGVDAGLSDRGIFFNWCLYVSNCAVLRSSTTCFHVKCLS